MKVKLKFLDVWEKFAGLKELEMEFENEITAEELLHYVISKFKVESDQSFSETVFISSGTSNFRTIRKSEIITDGTTILFCGPIIGG